MKMENGYRRISITMLDLKIEMRSGSGEAGRIIQPKILRAIARGRESGGFERVGSTVIISGSLLVRSRLNSSEKKKVGNPLATG